jgi:hypothetical protein
LSSAARQTKPVSDGLFLAWATAGLASVALRRTPYPQFRPNPAFEWMRGSHAKEIAMDMDSAEHCRVQAEECRRQLALAQNEAEISILTYLARSWVMIAGQIDRYVEIVKNRSAQKK